tara:strand:- start:184 stop:381 length:198 start_codon:yes stop_codon:yes gene_type:complete
MDWPRLILAATVPLVFVGIIVGKATKPDIVMDATIAGGLVAVVGAIVNGVLNMDNKKDKGDGTSS